MITKFALVAATVGILCAQPSPSGLLSGPVTYTSNLISGNPYGDTHVWTLADNSTCSAAGTPSCYIVKYVSGTGYMNLQASDGTSNGTVNCYTWDVWQLIMNDQGYCQTSFHGGGSGEQRVAIYCPNSTTNDTNGTYSFNATDCSFEGTAITVIGGVDVPIATLFTVTVIIEHTPTQVWIGPYFRTPRHLEIWQKITSMVVTVTPQGD